MFNISAVIVAAGSGKRFGGDKIFKEISGKYIIEYSLASFSAVDEIAEIVLVVNEAGFDKARSLKTKYPKISQVVLGGPERQESVRNGISVTSSDYVLIHDGARPNVSLALIKRVIEALKEYDAVVPALPVRDTVAYFVKGKYSKTLSREGLYHIQTPQGFKRELIIKALERASQNYTDESTLIFETLGVSAFLVEGDCNNLKITYPEDLEVFKRMIGECNLRIGLGFDSHRLEKGRKLVLGGVLITDEFGAVAHSDGDCLVHAVIDAILGALGERDIGTHFPNSDPAYKNVSSLSLLEKIWSTYGVDFEIVNLDCVVKLQRPKLMEFIPKMKENLGNVLNIPSNRISVKAKTGEKMGPIGEEKLIECEAVVLLKARL